MSSCYQEVATREMHQTTTTTETDYYEEPLHTIEELAGGYEESGAIHRLAMLSLNTTTTSAVNNHRCSACKSSAKRRSPSTLQEPATKKQLIFLPPPPPPPSSAAISAVSPPPTTTHFGNPPRLRRSVSDVVNYSPIFTPPPALISKTQSPETTKFEGSAAIAAVSPPPTTTHFGTPPRDTIHQRGLRRSVSDVVNYSLIFTPPPAPTLNPQSPENPQIAGNTQSPETHFGTPPGLRRSVSDVVNFSPIFTPPPETPKIAGNPQSPETPQIAGTASPAASLPPRPPYLRRSTSDPVHLLPSTPPSRRCSVSPDSGELASESRKLQKMRSGLIELLQEVDQVMQEERDQDQEEEENGFEDDDEKKTEEAETEEGETEEEEDSVSVEKSGDSLIVHFKCPCKKTFQILLTGNNCYYKLM